MPDEPGEPVRWRTVSWDILDLPSSRLKTSPSVKHIVRDIAPFPNREFEFQFEWNTNGEIWTWKVLMDGDVIIPWDTVRYADPYVYKNHVGFLFGDFKREESTVTRRNIGDEVELIAYPGPDSPAFDDWLRRQEILERELPQVGAL